MKALEHVINFFSDKCLVMDDMKHNITGRMQHLSPIATLQQANAEKLEKAKEILGSNWILHKDSTFVKEIPIKHKEGV
jgi:hypothetical protein